MRQQPIDRQRKAEALKLAAEHGSAEASRRTGVSADTIRYWRHKAAKAARPSDADVDDVERLERLARDLRAAAEEALAKAREAIAAGRGAEAKNLAVTAGVALDECGELARQVQAAREHQGRLAERDGRLLVEITEKAWAAIGVPLSGPAMRALAALMRQAQAGEELRPPAADAAEAREALRGAILAEAEAARCSILQQIGSELQAHTPQRGEGDGQRTLPAPNDDQDPRDRAEEMTGARRVISTLPERRQARSQSRSNGSNEVEVADGEVVDKPEGWGAAAAGRKVPDGRVLPLPEQDPAERAKADAEPKRQPQRSAPGDLYGDPSRWRYR